jgi:hypothetical protein
MAKQIRKTSEIILICMLVLLILPVWAVHVKGGKINTITTDGGITGTLFYKEDTVVSSANGVPVLYNIPMVLVRVIQDPFREECLQTKRISIVLLP